MTDNGEATPSSSLSGVKKEGEKDTGPVPFTQWIEERERQLLGEPSTAGNPWRTPYGTEAIGLAFSGGGIRSAAYCLGVMQTLVQHGWLKHIDYLSTVSGGGYIGTALNWYLRHTFDEDARGAEEAPEGTKETVRKKPRYGTHHDDFPFETEYGLGVLAAKMTGKRPDAGARGRGDRDLRRLEPLRYLRHSGRTMTPGGGLDNAALIAVMLRAVFTSLLTYGALMILIAALVHSPLITLGGVPLPAAAFDRVVPIGFSEGWAAPGALWLAGACVLLWPLSWFVRRLRHPDPVAARQHDIMEGLLVKVVVVLAMVGSLPLAVGGINILETEGGLGSATEALVGMFSVGAGLLGALGVFAGTNSPKARRLPLNVVAPIAGVLIIYGVLLFSFWAGAPETGFVTGGLFGFSGGLKGYAVGCLPLLIIAAGGWFQDLNDITPHRYYQDRLREIFLPDHPGLVQEDATELASSAWKRPYHLHNTHVLDPCLSHLKTWAPKLPSLVQTQNDRRGDSFLLSPLYVGSHATGWQKTGESVARSMPLASAMAASGAAAQPNAGTGGEGLTRGRAIGFLMSLLNLRMGYWVQTSDRPKRPDLVWPGLRSVAPGWLRRLADGKKPWVELSDGAHFENLGAYELIRRRCRVIIVCDAGADLEFRFSDLANLTEKVRSDFGTVIKVSGEELAKLVPPASEAAADATIRPSYSEHGYILASIKYTREAAEDAHGSEDGVLIFLKTTFFAKASGLGLPPDVYGYKAANPLFPDQSTTDQFFDERQFEAYRELGFASGFNLLQDLLSHDSSREPLESDDETPDQEAVRSEWLLREVVLDTIRKRALYRRVGDLKEGGDFAHDEVARDRMTSLWAWPDDRGGPPADLDEDAEVRPDLEDPDGDA